jgi:hypothetical protein
METVKPLLPKGECLETRIKDGLKWRRYRTPEGVVYTTYEIPTEIFHSVVPTGMYESRVQSWNRGQQRKEKRALAERLLQEGWKPLAIANEVGLVERTVTKYRKQLKDKADGNTGIKSKG